MNTIIAALKDTDYERIDRAVKDSGFNVSSVLSFGTSAVEEWAKKNDIPVKRYLVDRSVYGDRAEIIRNARMSGEAHAMIAVGEDADADAADMIERMRELKKPVYVGEQIF